MTSFGPKMPKNQGITDYPRVSEQGGAIVWIFVLITLFAALGYVLSDGTRSGEQNLSLYHSELATTEIVTYAKTIKDAVKVLQIEGCEDTEISFEHALLAGYSNPISPTDNSCHVFHRDGGGLFYKRPTNDINGAQDLIFTGNNDGSNIGTHCNLANCADLVLIYPNIPQTACQGINERFDIASSTNFLTQESDAVSQSPFVGTYTYSDRIIDGANELDKKLAGCFEGNNAPQSPGTYYFYQVLIAR